MIGRKVSHYEILEKLGSGGMGEIYKAQDPRLNRLVAIKVLSAGQAGTAGRKRFLQEAQAASALNHPNIITLHDIISQDDAEFMVMEFVSGKTLADLIPPQGLGVSDTLRYGVQIAGALQAAHTAGIVHRDLKPGNVMVTETGLVKVLDFGLAKFSNFNTSLTDKTQTLGDGPLTVEGSIIGTVSYMSPEQAQGRKVDPRSDIFSFGLVLYEMLTGHRAFHSDSAVSTLTAILRDEARPIAELVRDVPPEFEKLISRALRKSPDDRWQSMQEMQHAMMSLKQRSDSGAFEPTQLLPSIQKPKKTGLIAGIVGGVVLVAGGGAWWATHRTTPAPPQTAEAPASAPATAEPAPAAATPSAPTPATPTQPVAETLTNQSVLEMMEARVPTSVIISHIASAKTKFDLSTAEVIRLTKAGVPEAVLAAMRNPKAASATSAAPKLPPATPPAAQPGSQPTASPAPPPPVAPVPAPAAAAARTVTVSDGLPFSMTLLEDVPATPKPGTLLHFEASGDFRIGDTVVVAKGAPVLGAIMDVPKKGFLKGGKITYRLVSADAVDGSKIKLRATPSRSSSGPAERPLELPNRKVAKDLAAAAGSPYIAYIEGDHTVTVH